MKKFVPDAMIAKSRFVKLYETWSDDDRKRLRERMDKFIKENRVYADRKNYGYLCNLLTALGIVTVLEEKGRTREEAEREAADAMYAFLEPKIASMKKLSSRRWFVPFLKAAMPVKFRFTLGYGWKVDFPACPRDTFAMTTHQCIYQQIFSKYGMPEMTAVFCRVDDLLYSDLPGARFSYTEQLGTGGTMCDYRFTRKEPRT